MRWHATHFHTLHIEDWDGEYTVFQPDSGKTHFFNQMSMQMLIFLDQNPATTETISAYLAKQSQQNADENFSHHIEKILYHLEALGLIHKTSHSYQHDGQPDSI